MQGNNHVELIAKQLSGEITENELEILNTWIAQSNANKKDFEEYKQLWYGLNIKRTAKNADQVFSGVLDSLQKGHHHAEKTEKPKTFFLKYAAGAIAASLILIAVTVFSIYSLKTSGKVDQVSHFEMIEKALPAGQKMKFFLPDGSTVWLNAESTITYPERFDDSVRTVALKGEAYFSVVRDTLKPFIVQTDQFAVKVLGTTFNVNSYNADHTSKVALESGRVAVSLNNLKTPEPFVLSPGEEIVINKRNGSIDTRKIDPKISFQWKDGLLYFKKASFEEVVDKISRWYGVEIEVINYDGRPWEYTAEFQNDYLSTVLQSMSFTKGFDYDIDQNKVKIVFN